MNGQRKVITIGIIFLMMGITFAGCNQNNNPPENGNDNTVPLSYVDVDVLSETDTQVLENACASYIAMRKTLSMNESLPSLVTQLANDSDVKSVDLLDNTTIWIEFQDGNVTTISEYTTREYETTAMEHDYFSLKNDIVTGSQVIPVGSDNQEELREDIVSVPYVLPPVGASSGITEHVPESNKILFMSAATESFSNQDVDLLTLFKGYLVSDSGWSDDAITLKYNAESDGYQSLYFDDFFNLSEYGVIVVLAHGFYQHRPIDIHEIDSPEENFLYTQVRAGGTPTRLIGSYEIDTAAEYIDERIVYGVEIDPFKSTSTGYFYMRHDLWFEHIGTLPNSLVFLLHCQRETGDFIFPPKNIGNYVSWDNPVSPTDALDSCWLIPYMAVGDKSAYEILQDMILPKTAHATGTLQLYPGENDYLYLPAWIDIRLTSHPSDCTQVTIDISYDDHTVTPPDSDSLTESKDTLPHTFNGLIPGKRLKISAKALDKTGNVIDLKETTLTLTTGKNTLEMAFPGTSISYRFIEKYTETEVGSMGQKKPYYRWRYYIIYPMTLNAKSYWVTVHLNGCPLDENQQDNQQFFTQGYPPETVWDEVDEWKKDFDNGTRFYMIGGQDEIYEDGADLTPIFEKRDRYIALMQNWTFDIVPNFSL